MELIEGIKVTVRLHPARKLYEARWTTEKQRRSCYGKSQEEVLEKVRTRLCARKELRQFELDASARDSLGIYFVSQLGPIYESKGINTRQKGLWCIGQINKHFGHLAISTLSLGQIVTHWGHLQNAWPLPNTQRTILSIFSKGMRLLAREGRIPYNYAEEIDRPALTKRDAIPTVKEATAFLKAIKGDRLEPKVFLQFLLGLADEEANGLRLDDLKDGNLHVRGTKTENRDRVLPLPESIIAALRGYSKGKRTYFIEASPGHRYSSNSTRDFKVLAKRHKLTYFSNHCYRHAFATGLEELGCPPTVRLTLMGQSTRGAVQHLYVHPSQVVLRDWLEKWAVSTGVFEPVSSTNSRGTACGTTGGSVITK